MENSEIYHEMMLKHSGISTIVNKITNYRAIKYLHSHCTT